MPGYQSWSAVNSMDDWMTQQEKRVAHEERRPQINTASDLLGPGIAPHATPISDWNSEETLFNGIWVSEPDIGVEHSPDPSKRWIGVSYGTIDGYGYQQVWDDSDPVVSYTRTFSTIGDSPEFTDWVLLATGGGTGGPPTGAAGGDLTGTYPNPSIAPSAVTSSKIANGTIVDGDVNAANKDGTAATPSMRTLGTGAQQAAAGDHTHAAPTVVDHAAAVLALSPLVYYRRGEGFGSTAIDSSGNGRHGLYVGTNTLGVPGLLTGDSDTAVSTAGGTGNGSQTADGAWMRLQSFSVEVLIKPASLPTWNVIAGRSVQGTTGSTDSWFMALQGADVRILRTQGSTTTTFQVSGVATAGVTRHLVYTQAADGIGRLYVDGVLAGTSSAWLPNAGSQVLTVGMPTDGINSFNGTIDEFAYYGSVLTGTQVTNLFNSTVTPPSGGGGTGGGADEVVTFATGSEPSLSGVADGTLWVEYGTVVSDPTLGYTFVQGSPATSWVINHTLAFQPNVTVVDSSGRQVEGDVVYTDADTITITFSAAFSGKAHLS